MHAADQVKQQLMLYSPRSRFGPINFFCLIRWVPSPVALPYIDSASRTEHNSESRSSKQDSSHALISGVSLMKPTVSGSALLLALALCACGGGGSDTAPPNEQGGGPLPTASPRPTFNPTPQPTTSPQPTAAPTPEPTPSTAQSRWGSGSWGSMVWGN